MLIKTQTNQIDTPVLNSKCQYNHVNFMNVLGKHEASLKRFEKSKCLHHIVTAQQYYHTLTSSPTNARAKSIQKIKKKINNRITVINDKYREY